MNPTRLSKSDIARLFAALVLCCVSVVSFHFKDEAFALLRSWIGRTETVDTETVSAGENDAAVSAGEHDTNDTADVTPPEYVPLIEFMPDSGDKPIVVEINLFKPEPTPRSVEIRATVEISPEKEELIPETEVRIDVVDRRREGAPRVLIYHTHTEEAYEPTVVNAYVPHGERFTLNNERNMVAVGRALAEILADKYGMIVTHDTTNHCRPNFDTAYTSSLATLRKYTERGETFDLYIDLHRDSYSKKHSENFVVLGGVEVARIMALIGKGEGYSQKPDWQKNLALANSLTDRLNAIEPTLCDKVVIYSGNRYNQHVSPNALLIEVGNTKNTLEQALAAMPYLAEAIDVVLGGTP